MRDADANRPKVENTLVIINPTMIAVVAPLDFVAV